MRFLENISLSLRAVGPSAVLIVWLLSITSLGLFGTSELAKSALYIVGFFGAMLIGALGHRA